MAKHIPPPPDFEIAALQKKVVESRNPMEAGSGTPWEDRGTLGVIGAFFKTCVMSLKAPGQLLVQIRRPETIGDGRAFASGCGVCWGVSLVIHRLLMLRLWYHDDRRYEIDMTFFWIENALFFAGAIGGVLLFIHVVSRIYHKMVESEIKHPVTPALFVNLFSYALAPSLLALVPVAGPVLAVCWILALLVIAGSARLRLNAGSAAVASFISVAAMVLACLAAWFVVRMLVWEAMTGGAINEVKMPDV
jgi:hypothetical protein